MAIELICQGCSSKLRVGDEHAGKQARCPQCGTLMPVPMSSGLGGLSAGLGGIGGGAAGGSTPLGGSSLGGNSLGGAPLNGSSLGTGAAAAPASPSGGVGATGERWLMRAEDGRVYGPVSRADLDGWAREGRVSPRASLAREGTEAWQPAVQLYPHLATQGSMGGGSNPFADRPSSAGQVFSAANMGGAYGAPVGGGSRYAQPHRGGLILSFAIISWVICFFFGIAALIMGLQDMSAMKQGRMDPSGMGLTQAGVIIAGLQLGLFVLFLGFGIIAAILGN